MKKLIITLSIVVSGLMSQAQQVPLLSHYYYNKFVWNPALAGNQSYGQAYLIYRNQWNSIPGAPVTMAATIDGPLKSKNVGIGANLYSDRAGIFNRTGGMISYAYGINLSEESKLKLGLGLGFIDNRLVFDDVHVRDADDPYLQVNNNNKSTFDANFGFNYTYKDFNFGMSLPQVLALNTKFNAAGDSGDIVYKNARHFQFMTSYVFRAMEDKIKIEPIAFIRLTPNTPFQFDLSAVVSYRDFIWGGLMYRSGNAIGLMAGLRIAKQFVLGYAYDLPINSYRKQTGGSNEFMVGYQFGGKAGDDDELKKRLKGIDDRLDNHDVRIEDLDKRVKTNTSDIEDLKKDVKQNTDDNKRQDVEIDSLKILFSEFRTRVGKGTVEVGEIYEFSNVHFGTNRYDVTPDATKELNELASLMKENPALKIEISGHTDERGTDEYNQRLSERRSKAIVDYLVSKGVPRDRLVIYNFGEKKPIEAGSSPDAWQANRRVEFKVLEK